MQLESLKCFGHLCELLQGKQLSINDECDLAIGIGDPASHSSVGGLEVSGLSLLDMARRKRCLDSSAKSTECQIGTRRIELPEEESLPVFSFFFRLHAKPKADAEVRDNEGPGLTRAVGKRLSNRKVLVGIVAFARFVGKSPTAVWMNHFSHFLKTGFLRPQRIVPIQPGQRVGGRGYLVGLPGAEPWLAVWVISGGCAGSRLWIWRECMKNPRPPPRCFRVE